MDDSAIGNTTIAIQCPVCGKPEMESDINYSQDSVLLNGEGMREPGSAREILTRVELDLVYYSEKLVNLDVLVIHVAARESDFEAITVEGDDVLADSVEKAMEFNLLSGVLDSEIKELDNFMEYLEREIVEARQKIYSCKNLRDAFPEMEEKFHDSEESLKQSKDRISELRMHSTKFQRTLLAYSWQENWNDGKVADYSESNQFSGRNAKLKMQTAEQQRHILRMLEKSLARELDLEKKLSESRQNEEELKLKLHSMEHEVFCMGEEAEEIVWERLLEAENTAQLLTGISKEVMGQLHIVQFNVNSLIERESEMDSKLKDSMERLSAKESAFHKLESSSAELYNFLLDQTTSLKASLKEAEDKYILANSEAFTLREKVNSLEEQLKESEVKLQNAKGSLEASQVENGVLKSEINEMENVIKDLKKNMSEAASKAENAEPKSFLFAQTDLELNQEINFLEKQLREADTQLEHAKAISEASQEQQNLLYSAIEDMENLIEGMKSKFSKTESRAESAEAKCILLCETNMELNEEVNFLRARIESLESSLHKDDNAKVATAKDIRFRTKVITDLVMQLARERKRVQKQISSLINENKNLVMLLRTRGVSVTMSNQGNETNKEPPVSEDDLITTSSIKVSKEEVMESSATGFQLLKTATPLSSIIQAIEDCHASHTSNNRCGTALFHLGGPGFLLFSSDLNSR
ncbi:WPP domain-interacting tail-anchored protein 1-like isoform X3 [Macadamia integrifolia]|uniref:WPP domain-interacting tail-anchored protein 1-like isoform X2 n=1 Tax=Macadamia integrifolia TaxID=60698 RepID=UPI001C4FE907|nr:WPP domain-interacting tail-anchored protein 1-like isoform X2 [Macadamia integrifolia]XP_042511317.1 WPP domain-interacting tail-anchored protein 1-like isoform X3 [Macadamia integrifolia]